jgi:hypothetical protein
VIETDRAWSTSVQDADDWKTGWDKGNVLMVLVHISLLLLGWLFYIRILFGLLTTSRNRAKEKEKARGQTHRERGREINKKNMYTKRHMSKAHPLSTCFAYVPYMPELELVKTRSKPR